MFCVCSSCGESSPERPSSLRNLPSPNNTTTAISTLRQPIRSTPAYQLGTLFQVTQTDSTRCRHPTPIRALVWHTAGSSSRAKFYTLVETSRGDSHHLVPERLVRLEIDNTPYSSCLSFPHSVCSPLSWSCFLRDETQPRLMVTFPPTPHLCYFHDPFVTDVILNHPTVYDFVSSLSLTLVRSRSLSLICVCYIISLLTSIS